MKKTKNENEYYDFSDSVAITTSEALLDFLTLSDGGEFTDFENLADLFEADETITPEALCPFLKDVDMSTLARITKEYFDEIMPAIPDAATEIYTVFEDIKRVISGMAANAFEDHDIVLLANEMLKFKNWYTLEDTCACISEKTGVTEYASIRDALVLRRLEKMGHDEYSYDFDAIPEYEMESYTMSFADIIRQEEGYADYGSDRDAAADNYESDDVRYSNDGTYDDYRGKVFGSIEELGDGFVYDDGFRDDSDDEF